MSKVGPRQLTLAAIAKQAGVTAAVLVQRFGSKRSLLLALSKKMRQRRHRVHRGSLGTARLSAHSLARLPGLHVWIGGLAGGSGAQPAYLQIDLTDPDFRRHLVKQARHARRLARAGRSSPERFDAYLGLLSGRDRGTVDACGLEAVLEPYLPRKRR